MIIPAESTGLTVKTPPKDISMNHMPVAVQVAAAIPMSMFMLEPEWDTVGTTVQAFPLDLAGEIPIGVLALVSVGDIRTMDGDIRIMDGAIHITDGVTPTTAGMTHGITPMAVADVVMVITDTPHIMPPPFITAAANHFTAQTIAGTLRMLEPIRVKRHRANKETAGPAPMHPIPGTVHNQILQIPVQAGPLRLTGKNTGITVRM